MAEAQELRAKHSTFTYQGYNWELAGSDLTISFHFQTSPDINFKPVLTIHRVTQAMIDKVGKNAIDNYVFNIGLADMFSYWKATASPEIIIRVGKLAPDAINFWQKLLLKGMGEFFYTNQIDFSGENFVKITSKSDQEHILVKQDLVKPDAKIPPSGSQDAAASANSTEPPTATTAAADTTVTPRVLIPIGGGKDSSVTLEILKNNFEVGSFIVSAPKSAQSIIDVSRVPMDNQIQLTRILDPKIFELNENGYLNGHVPISAYLAFLSYLTADLFGYSHIAISNERSSNEGNVWYCDQDINHQYSKTYEFERDLQDYTTKFLPNNTPFFFSFMRPLYELQIARIFSHLPDHHPVFRSCNRGQKQNVWCKECSKCLFAWTILFPFLGPEKLTAYFGQNLFENDNLWPIAKELLGLSATKPFECVGTHEESIIAFYLCTKYYKQRNIRMPLMIEKINFELENNVKLKSGPTSITDFETRANALLIGWNEQNSLPHEFAELLKQELEKSKTYAPNL